MFLHKNALSQKRSEYRPLGWKNFGECSIRLRWGSQNLGSFLLITQVVTRFKHFSAFFHTPNQNSSNTSSINSLVLYFYNLWRNQLYIESLHLSSPY
jgi:hypothetical protein